MSGMQHVLRELPSIDRLLNRPETRALLGEFSREYLTDTCRRILDDLRAAIRRGEPVGVDEIDERRIVERLAREVEASRRSSLVRVINATGTVLHTNLGRALLPEAAIEALCVAARHPVNLEYEIDRGERGRREDAIERLLVDLTAAEAATVVNNNAAAVLLALNTLAAGKDVVVSRGELIEIGGAFRIPEIMAKSHARLREVGTTNRTHPSDFEQAINASTGLLLKVHTSNYRIVGFTSTVTTSELVEMGKRHNVPVMEDLGSGALVDLSRYGLAKEPLVAEQVAAGVDVVTFSGDKLLGGPQAGLIVGTSASMKRIVGNPLHRALRCDKLTIAALEATLRLYRQSTRLTEQIPTLMLLARPLAELEALAARTIPALENALGRDFRVSLESSTSQVGSGALPAEEMPTKVVAIEHGSQPAEWVARRFREARPPIIGRIHDGRFLLDLRAVLDPEDLVPHWA
jgi:L-seryl-tRNA(Ser) seleniumtransferase